MGIELIVAGLAAAAPFVVDALSGDDPDPERVKAGNAGDVKAQLGNPGEDRGQSDASFNRSHEARYGTDGAWQGEADLTNSNQSRGEQTNALGMLKSSAMGNGPSAARATLQSGLDQGMANNRAMAATSKGGGASAASALRLAQLSNANAGFQGAQQAAILRANEMRAAQNDYMGAASGLRGQDWQQAYGLSSLRGQAQGMRNNQEQFFSSLGRQQRQDAFNNDMSMLGMDMARRSGNAEFLSQQQDREDRATAAAFGAATQIAPVAYGIAKDANSDTGMPAATTTGPGGKNTKLG